MSNYAIKKELEHAPGVDKYDLAAKKDFIALKAKVDKLDTKKLTNVPTSLNNLKTKVDDLDVGKLKTVLEDLKKLSDVVEKKIPDATTLIHINQYNTDKQNLEKKMGMLIKNTRYECLSDYSCFEYKN